MCGEAAMFECPECYETEHTELSSAAFCENCSNTVRPANDNCFVHDHWYFHLIKAASFKDLYEMTFYIQILCCCSIGFDLLLGRRL